MTTRSRSSILVLFFLIVAYFAFRAPFFSQILMGEEGLFANIFFSSPPGPKYILLARIDGNEIYGIPEHPAGLYQVVSVVGMASQYVVEKTGLTEIKRTTLVRFVFSLFQFSIWMWLFIILARFMVKTATQDFELKKFLPMLFLASIMISPLAIGQSLCLQTDTSAGVLMTGLAAIAWLSTLMYTKGSVNKRIFACPSAAIFFSTGFLGLGKNEWTISFLASLVLTLLVVWNRKDRAELAYIAIAFCGLIFGNIVSYLYDPGNYLGGFHVISRLLPYNPLAVAGVSTFSKVSGHRIPFLLTIIIILFFLGTSLFRNGIRNQPISIVFTTLFGLCLLAPYLVSTWNAQPRYFVPAMIVLVAAAVGIFISGPVQYPKLLGLICVVMILQSISFVYSHSREGLSVCIHPGTTLPRERDYWKAKQPSDGECVPLLDSAAVYSEKQIDFIGRDIGIEGARKIAGSRGKKVCAEK